jgi:hypothetical protein
VGLSAGDKVFGAVRVTWNDNPVDNLYLSTIELTNQSMKDYENVVVRAYTSDSILLTERTEIVGTTHIVNRHLETDYDRLLARGYDRREARMEVESAVGKVFRSWEAQG